MHLRARARGIKINKKIKNNNKKIKKNETFKNLASILARETHSAYGNSCCIGYGWPLCIHVLLAVDLSLCPERVSTSTKMITSRDIHIYIRIYIFTRAMFPLDAMRWHAEESRRRIERIFISFFHPYLSRTAPIPEMVGQRFLLLGLRSLLNTGQNR